MQANWSERTEERYRQLSSSLSSTADIIRQSKEMLGRPREELIQCHRTLYLDPNGSKKNIEVRLTCNITVGHTSSRRDLGRTEIAPIEIPFRPPSSVLMERTMEPSFSFGKLHPPIIGMDDEEPKPEDSDRHPRNRLAELYQSPPPNRQKVTSKELEEAPPPTTIEPHQPSQNLSFHKQRNHGIAEPINASAIDSNVMRDSGYRSAPAHRSSSSSHTNDKILIEEEVQEAPPPIVRPIAQLPRPASNADPTPKKHVDFTDTTTTHPSQPVTPQRKRPYRIDKSSSNQSRLSTDEKYRSVKERVRTEMSASMELRKQYEQPRTRYADLMNPQSKRRSISRSRSPSFAENHSPSRSRIMQHHRSEMAIQGTRTIACPRFRRQVQRDIRVQFLNQYSSLYTQKRLSYEQLFDLYYDIRVKRLPEYRWPEHVHDYMRKNRHQPSPQKI